MTKTLVRFTIEPEGDGVILSLEDEDGEVVEFLSDREQLDLLVETLEEFMLSDGLGEDVTEEDDES